MFSLLHARLASRLAYSSGIAALTRTSTIPAAARLGQVMLSAQTRTFLTGTQSLAFPAATTKSSAGRKSTKTAATKKSTAVKKSAKKPTKRKAVKKPIKKKVVPKKKKVEKKPVKPKISPEQLPPKRPGVPHTLFIAEQLKDNSLSLEGRQTMMKECSEKWKDLPIAEKSVYEARYAVALEEYRTKYLEWYKNTDPKLIRYLNKVRRSKGKRSLRRPPSLPRAPPSGYLAFAKENYDPSRSLVENAKSTGSAWKALPATEREKRSAQAKAEQIQWRREHDQ